MDRPFGMPGFPGKPPGERPEEKEEKKPFKEYIKDAFVGTPGRLLYIFKLVWETQPWLFVFRLIITLYNGFMPIVGTYITANLLGKVVLSFSQDVELIPALVWQFGYLFLNTLKNSISDMVTRASGEKVTHHIKIKIMQKAKEVDLKSFDMPEFYEKLENASREAGTRPLGILNNSFDLVAKFISMVSYFVVLGNVLNNLPGYSIIFFVLFILLSATSAVVMFYFRRKNYRYMFRRSKERREMNYYSDILVNKDLVKEIRLFDLSDMFIGKYRQAFSEYFKGMNDLIRKSGIWDIIFALLTAGVNGALFYMIATNVTQIENYSIYTGALNSIASLLASVIGVVASIYEGSLFIDNMIMFMKEEQTVKPQLSNPVKPEFGIGHTIEFKDVSFHYPGFDTNVIEHMNFTFRAGETVALVGINGAGKTTLIKLITRLYDPTEGSILLDGRDIKDYDLKSLYSLYGIIFQDFGKYADTAGNNIAYGKLDKEKTLDGVRNAAVQSGADAFISTLSSGYDTPLTRWFYNDGRELSIGQWQKLSVARAFYSGADILILDEPTASLDAFAEQEIYNRFDVLRKGKTSIFVSHRLSSATTADRVIVLSGGTIIEEGTHDELMKLHGEYFKLFSTQASHYISGAGENASDIRDFSVPPEFLKEPRHRHDIRHGE